MFSRSVIVAALVASHATTQCSQCSKEEGESRGADAVAAPVTASRTASCDRVPSMSICSEYAGAYLAQNEAVLSSSCGKLGGTFVGAECPNTAVLGSCVLSTTEVRKFYASGGAVYDAARAQKECEGSYRGKWSAFR
jgi:hypothetical protein